ncbi:hypothetical protein GCM10009742_34980 [Kribbella karoonensis]|uniref:Uncharacterized protein n=1 Tax=Kribbella karoonensis TaxID=324851 RepID=A0ABN2DTF6_9ACTN
MDEDRPDLGVRAAGLHRPVGDQRDPIAGARDGQATAQRLTAFRGPGNDGVSEIVVVVAADPVQVRNRYALIPQLCVHVEGTQSNAKL